MQTKRILASCSLVVGLALAQPAAAINCENGFQRIKGDLIQTPYCQDAYLAEVALQYGFTVSAARIRNDPNYKKSICRYVFNDIRVQDTCLSAGVPEHFGGH
jgi:hypothetical protein